MTEEQEEAISKHLESECFVIEDSRIKCYTFTCLQCGLYHDSHIICATIKEEYRKNYPELTL